MISTGGGGTDQGNITVSQPITWATATTLTLDADNNIAINAAITGTALSKGLVLAAGTTTATGSITISAAINVNTLAAAAGAAGTINLSDGAGAIVATNGGGQTYSSPVVLQAAANVVDTLNGAVKFVGALDGTTAGGQSLTVTAGNGIVTFGGAVGANVALGTLSVTGPTTLLGDVQTIGKQTFNSAVTLGATAAVTALNNSVDFAGTVNAATAGVQGLTVTAGNGTVTFNDVVGGTAALASLTVSGPTTLAGNVRTTGTQTYNSAVTLGASNTLQTTDAAITLRAPVAGGANTLTLSSGTGAQTLSGITTGGNLVLNTTGSVTLNSGGYTITGGANPYVFPAVTVNGGITLGQATKFGAVTLGSTTLINSSAGNDDLDFTGKVDATTAGVEALTVTAGTGSVTFGGAVGGSTVLASLRAIGGTITLDGDVTTTGTLALISNGAGTTLAINKTLSASQVTLNSSGDITESGAISAALLTGSSSGNANFSGINSISALGDFAATGDFVLRNGAAFSVVGTVTAGPVTPPGPNSGNINTISLTSAAGTLAIGTVGSIGVLDAGNVVLSAAGTISEPNGTIVANTLTAATTTSGDITLSSTGNAVTTVTGANATNGNVALVFGPTTTLTGSYKGNNLFFEAAGTGDTLKIGDAATGVAMSATAASKPRISLVADFITEGSQPNTITAKGGTVELAPFTSGRGVSLAGTAGGHLLIDGTLLNDISTNTGTVVVGQFTDVPNSGTLNASGGNLSIDGAVSLAGIASTLDLVSQGSITETAGPLFVGSLIGNAASGTLLATGNSIGTVAFTATNGDVQIVDGAALNVGSVNAPNGNIYLASSNVAGINAAGANMVASATGRIGFKTDAISGFGTAKLSSGTLELAPFSSPVTITLGAPGGLSVGNGDLVGATATLWRLGAVTEPGGFTPTTTANALVVGGAFGLSTVAIELDSTGAISGSGVLTAGKLSGSAGSSANLNGPNAITLLGDFTAASGFTLNDVAGLTVSSGATVSGGPDVTINDNGALSIVGTVTGATVELGGAGIDIGGAVTGPTSVTLISGGSVTGAGVITTALLTGGAGGNVALTGANAVTGLGNFSATTGFTLDDVPGLTVIAGNTVHGGSNVTIADTGALSVAGAVTGATVVLGGSGIDIAGTVIGPTSVTLTSGGSITGAGVVATALLMGSAGTDVDLTGANSVTGLGNFTAKTGFTLDDVAGLAVIAADTVNGGSNVTIADIGPLSVAGTVTGTTVGLSGAGIDIGGAVTGPSSVTLTSGGAITGGGVVTTALLTGSAGTNVDLTGLNAVTGLGNFTATSGFTLDDVLGLNVNSGAIVDGGFNVTIVDTGALSVAGTVTGTTVELSGAGVGIGGAVTGPASVTLTSGSSITGAGVITTALLTGSAGTNVDLTGANAVTGLGNFTAKTGFILDDVPGLSVIAANTVDGGSNVTIADKGALTVAGTLTGATVGLNGAGIDISGAVNGPTQVTLTSGGSITGVGVITTALLTGSAGTNVDLTGANAISHLGGFTATTGFTLDNAPGLTVNSGAILDGGSNVTIADSGALNVAGTVTGTTVGLSGAGIDIGGVVTGPTSVTLTSGGSITGAGIVTTALLTGSAGTDVDLTGANAVTGLGNFTTATGFILDDAAALTVIAANTVNGGSSVTITDTGALSVAGTVIGTTVGLSGASIDIDGAVTGPTSVTLTSGGNIIGAGVITTALLTGSAGTNVDLTGANLITGLGNFTATTGFILDDVAELTVNAADTVDGGSNVTLADIGALNVAGTVTGTMVGLSGASIGLSGAVNGPTSVALTSGGSIAGSGVITTPLLTGSAGTDVDLTGANAITGLGNFTATTGFTLDDVPGLTVNSGATVDGGSSVTISETGALSVAGTVIGTTVGLSGASIGISGAVTGPSSVTLTSAGNIIGAGVISTALLTGSAGGNVSLTGSNAVTGLGNFTAKTGFTLDDVPGLTVLASNTVDSGSDVVISDIGALSVAGTVTGTTVALSGSGIDIPGAVNGPTGVILTSGGGITGVGIITTALLTGSAGTNVALTGANAITNLGNFTATTGFILNDVPGLTVNSGATVDGGSNVTISDTGVLSVAGQVIGTTAALSGAGIGIGGSVSGPTSVTLTSGGSITGAGVVTTALLTGSAGTSVDLTGANAVTGLGNFAATSGFTLKDVPGLTVISTDTVSGGSNVTISDIGALSVAGAVIGTTVELSGAGSTSADR